MKFKTVRIQMCLIISQTKNNKKDGIIQSANRSVTRLMVGIDSQQTDGVVNMCLKNCKSNIHEGH